MKHYVFMTYDENTETIVNCWEASTLPEGVDNPIDNIGMPLNYKVIQIDIDDEIENIKENIKIKGKSISQWILENKKIDKLSLKPKGKIQIGKLKEVI